MANNPRFMEWAQGNSPLPEETQRLISLLSEETQALLSTGGGLHPEASSIIPLLSQFNKHQEHEYDKLSHDHMLSFLLGEGEGWTCLLGVVGRAPRLAFDILAPPLDHFTDAPQHARCFHYHSAPLNGHL